MSRSDINPLRDILQRMLVKYLTVRPHGIQIDPERKPRPSLEARIVGYGGARTLYRRRQPKCRSLDGVQSVTQPSKLCSDCSDLQQCTSQVRVDLFVDQLPFRLMLAYTSARNFFEYTADLKRRKLTLEEIMHRIDVINRGTWGELRFSPVPR